MLSTDYRLLVSRFGAWDFLKSKIKGVPSSIFPLKVRGIKGGYLYNSPYPSYSKRGSFEKLDELLSCDLWGLLH
jgi:hypothetical protein